MSQPVVEVMIPTLNEADHISDAVANALQLGPVFVLDSYSTDDTQVLARRAGATVVEHPLEGYARRKNWGLVNLPLRSQWVFILDADERITPALAQEVLARAADPKSCDGYFVKRLMIYMGQPIRHGGVYPSWSLRFFRRGRCRYEDLSGHERLICKGTTDYLHHQMLHIRRESVEQYLNKHIHYVDLESDEWVKLKTQQSQGAEEACLLQYALHYRQWLRRKMWLALPAKPIWRFLYMYFFRLGILDGRAGWALALLAACDEYMISLLYREKLQKIGRAAKAPSARAAQLAPVAEPVTQPALPSKNDRQCERCQTD